MGPMLAGDQPVVSSVDAYPAYCPEYPPPYGLYGGYPAFCGGSAPAYPGVAPYTVPRCPLTGEYAGGCCAIRAWRDCSASRACALAGSIISTWSRWALASCRRPACWSAIARFTRVTWLLGRRLTAVESACDASFAMPRRE